MNNEDQNKSEVRNQIRVISIITASFYHITQKQLNFTIVILELHTNPCQYRNKNTRNNKKPTVHIVC